MDEYDPDLDPSADEWQILDEQEQIILVEEYHRRARIKIAGAKLHAVTHVVVENQLALGIPAVVDAMSRLRHEGLDRHDALHAIGLVLNEHMLALSQTGVSDKDPNEGYHASLRRLTAQRWRDYGKA